MQFQVYFDRLISFQVVILSIVIHYVLDFNYVCDTDYIYDAINYVCDTDYLYDAIYLDYFDAIYYNFYYLYDIIY